MALAIRSATSNDIPAMVAIERLAWGASHWTSEQYGRLIAGGLVLVAELGAELIPEQGPELMAEEVAEEAGGLTLCGFVCAKAVAGEWEIENVAVAPDFLRRGVAGELIRELIRRAIEGAASAVHLEVRESNAPARGLYEKNKFREVGRRKAYYKDPGDDAILYVLKLGR